MRLFVALDLPDGLREALFDVQDDLGFAREVPEENLHLTLAFLDDQPPQVAQALHEGLSEIRAPRMDLAVRGAEVFGGARPALLAALVERTPDLAALHDKVGQVARMAGIDLPRKRFKPHVTLLRFPRRLPDGAQDRIGAWLAANGALSAQGQAETFSLIRSTLHEDGPRYEALATYSLMP